MNIFFSDADPVKAAQNLDDKRVVKMILESAQMLCTALRLNNATHLAQYKATHGNHPSNVWCRTTDSNYAWLLAHMIALCDEYSFRYGKVHASEALIPNLRAGQAFIPKGPLTPFANCAARSDMGIDFKWMTDVTSAYKMYLVSRWARDSKFPNWSKRGQPQFCKAIVGLTVNTLPKLLAPPRRSNVQLDTDTTEVH